jgi:hypothetical protein
MQLALTPFLFIVGLAALSSFMAFGIVLLVLAPYNVYSNMKFLQRTRPRPPAAAPATLPVARAKPARPSAR